MGLKLGTNLDHSKIVKSLGQKYKLVPHLDMAIAEAGDFSWGFQYEPKLSDDAWHPSGDCTPSLHELYLKATGQAEPWEIPVSLRKTFLVGHFWHQYLQRLVVLNLGFAAWGAVERTGRRGWGPTFHGDHEIDGIGYNSYHWATGSGDIAPCVIPGQGEFAIDFKTMNARMFKTGPPAEYMAKWECQGNVYLEFFDLERVIFVGVCKDSPHEMREWEFARNQPLIDSIYAKWKLVSECVDEGVVPPEDEPWDLPLQGPVGA